MNWFRTIFLLISCIVMLVTYSFADEQHTKERKDKNHHNQESDENGDKRLPSPQNQTYLNFCGSCHFAYQPGLLPRASWEKMMSEGHFGTLDEQTRKQIMVFCHIWKQRVSHPQYFRLSAVAWRNNSLPLLSGHLTVQAFKPLRKHSLKLSGNLVPLDRWENFWSFFLSRHFPEFET